MAMEKLKNWYEEHADVILEVEECLTFVAAVGAAGLWGWNVGRWCLAHDVNMGTWRLREKGILKFVNPENGSEINMEEAAELMKKIALADKKK